VGTTTTGTTTTTTGGGTTTTTGGGTTTTGGGGGDGGETSFLEVPIQVPSTLADYIALSVDKKLQKLSILNVCALSMYLDKLLMDSVVGFDSIWDPNLPEDKRPSEELINDRITYFLVHSHDLFHPAYPNGINESVTVQWTATVSDDFKVSQEIKDTAAETLRPLLKSYVNSVLARDKDDERANRRLLKTLADNLDLAGGINGDLFKIFFTVQGASLGGVDNHEIAVKTIMLTIISDATSQLRMVALNLCLHQLSVVMLDMQRLITVSAAGSITRALPHATTPSTSPTIIPPTTPTRPRPTLAYDTAGETKSPPVDTVTGGPSHVEQSMDGVFGFFNNVAEFLHIPGPRIPLIRDRDSARIAAGGGSTSPPGTSTPPPAGSSSTPIPSTSGLISTTPPAINTFQVGQAQDASTVLGAAGLHGFPVGSINMKSAIELDPKKMLDTIEMQKRIFSQVIDTTNKLPLATLESKNTDDKDVLIREANKIVRQYGREIGLYTLPYTALHPLGMVKEQYNFVLRKANEWLKLISGSQTADGKQLSALHDNYTKAQQIIDEALNLNSIMKAKAVGVTEAQNENTRLAGLAIQAAGQYALGGNRDLGLAFATSVPPLPFFQVGRYAGDKKRPMEKLVEDEVYLPSLYGPTMGDCILRITKLPRRDPIPFNDHPSFEYV
jgi:hypothetical protein